MKRTLPWLVALAGAAAPGAAAAPEAGAGALAATVHVAGGSYVPLYGGADPVEVPEFRLDRHPVTNAEFLDFVRARPRWRRSRAPSLLAEAGYLRHWRADLELGEGSGAPLPDAPVTFVSWFAAREFCAWRGQRLPTLDEWELVALADATRRDATGDPAFHQRILDWYAKPRPRRLPPVGSTSVNAYGISDLHGLVWEWVEDFNSVFVTGESRADGSVDRELYCAAAGSGAGDARNYAAFLRYAMRSSLEARYTVGNLGFRCAEDAA